MKSLVFILVLAASSISLAQTVVPSPSSTASTVTPAPSSTGQQVRSAALTAVLECNMTTKDSGDFAIEMIFDYDDKVRTYTLSSVGAAGRGITPDSPNYFWNIKSNIDLSRLAADISLTQTDGSHLEFTMLARMTGIVMNRNEGGFLPTQSLQYAGLIDGALVSGILTCTDAEMPPPAQAN